MRKLAFLLSIVGLILLLTSCVTILSADSTVTLFPDERWKISYEILFDGVEYAEAGDMVTEGIESLKQMAFLEGVVVKSKKLPAQSGNIPYQVTLSGKGLDSLNSMLGVEDAFTSTMESGQKVYLFNLDAVYLVTGGLSIGSTPDFSFTLEGVDVIDTNSQRQTVVSATWNNPTDVMYAKFQLKRGGIGDDFPWWIIPVVLGGLAVITLVILLATGAFKKKTPPAYGIPPMFAASSLPLPPIPGAPLASPPPVPASTSGTPPSFQATMPPPLSPSVPPTIGTQTPPQRPVSPNEQATVMAQRNREK